MPVLELKKIMILQWDMLSASTQRDFRGKKS